MSLENYIKQCDLAYFNGKPLIPDDVYDRLKKVDSLGYKDNREERVAHTYPMWSLQKVFLGKDPAPHWQQEDRACVMTPKLDGAAVSLLFVEGKLQLALTRGDGKKGVPITEKMQTMMNGDLETTRKVFQVN